MSGVEISSGGPVFDGRAAQAQRDAADASERQLAIIGASMVRTNLNAVLKTQTPYYRMRVEAKQEAPGWKITDQGVIYGFWLEGIGSRNAPVTRFRGYATFRRTTQAIQARAQAIGSDVVARFIGRMQ